MLRPEGRVAVIWKGLMSVVDATYTAFLVPLSFAFFHDVRIFNWMSVLDIVGSKPHGFPLTMLCVSAQHANELSCC